MLLLFLYEVSLFLSIFPDQYLSSRCDPLLLTPYIEANRLVEAKELSEVKHLSPNFHIKSYSGFLTVDKKYGSNLFFWFFPSLVIILLFDNKLFNLIIRLQKNPKTAPVVLWLQGGPGSSSMFALFSENGPFYVNENIELIRNNYSWAQEFSMLYIDNPVGTGFSFTEDNGGLARNEVNVADNLYEALQQFFKLFSEYRLNEFYVTGESYAGKYVPAIGYKLHQMSAKSNINFKGIAIGNGWIDPISMLDIGSFLYQMGLIDENQLNHFFEIQNKTAIDIKNKDFRNAFIINDQLIGDYHKF